ncbi:MAG: class I SAM-dependent methyltransferase [Longimicrobiales bacterium]
MNEAMQDMDMTGDTTLATAGHRVVRLARAVHRKRTSCRACGGRRLRMVVSLGQQPLANSLPRETSGFDHEAVFPLDAYFCDDCSLLQLLDVIDAQTLFRDYIYVTGTSSTIAEHNERYARAVIEQVGAGRNDLILEIASNDGSLLKCFTAYGVRTLGVEPASNIAAMARAAGIETVNEFFDSGTAAALLRSHGPAKAVIANNVLAHVDDTRDFLSGVRSVLAPDGYAIIEVPYLGELLGRLEYDTIYHEHLCYFSVTTLLRLADAVGLSVRRIDRVPVHGGSLRVFARPASRDAGHDAAVLAIADQEERGGLTRPAAYERFAARVADSRTALLALLNKLRDDGRTIAGYGAPAKGNTLLNYCGIGTDLVDFTVDRNPLKVGRYTPGMHLPILSVDALIERQPDYVLILAWNFADEIIAQQTGYRARGGRFILPIPEPRII